jgi:hypothetical protein
LAIVAILTKSKGMQILVLPIVSLPKVYPHYADTSTGAITTNNQDQNWEKNSQLRAAKTVSQKQDNPRAKAETNHHPPSEQAANQRQNKPPARSRTNCQPTADRSANHQLNKPPSCSNTIRFRPTKKQLRQPRATQTASDADRRSTIIQSCHRSAITKGHCIN